MSPAIDAAAERVKDNGGQVLNGPIEVPGGPGSSSAAIRRARCSRWSGRAASPPHPMFDKILIANRGEIACRVIAHGAPAGRRAPSPSIPTPTRGALHVALADEAVPIGPAAGRAKAICAATRSSPPRRRAGAEAIHPGYGFLSENADFADAVAAAGLVFIGPPPAAIRAMGVEGRAPRR